MQCQDEVVYSIAKFTRLRHETKIKGAPNVEDI